MAVKMIKAESLGWHASGLDALVAFANSCGTAQLVIRHRDGLLVSESFDPAPVDVHAVQKGLLAILFGIAEEKYLLEICDAINHHLPPEWTNLSPWTEASLTIEGLLTMVTGMDDKLDELGKVGETWRYNNTAYNYLKKILCLHTGKSLNELSKEWLFEPLSMLNTQWVDRQQLLPDGSPLTGLVSTAEDLSQFGLMVLNHGESDGVSIVPRYFLDQIALPGSKENPAWGLCWWNNNQASFKLPFVDKEFTGPIIPDAPSDLIALRGALEEALYVIPSLDLVIVRTTKMPEKGQQNPRFQKQFWSLLNEARMTTGG